MKTKKEIKKYLKEKFTYIKEKDTLEYFSTIYYNICFQLDFKINLYAVLKDSQIGLEDENNIEVIIFEKENSFTDKDKEEFIFSLEEYYLDELEGINPYSVIYSLNQIIVTIDCEY